MDEMTDTEKQRMASQFKEWNAESPDTKEWSEKVDVTKEEIDILMRQSMKDKAMGKPEEMLFYTNKDKTRWAYRKKLKRL